ncbi:MAG: dihydrolipoamide acetyltransferase family protein [Pelolinea sp.]|nr:dihydrolipoamide acetyltransferase family protein [Pelolinea sp.]
MEINIVIPQIGEAVSELIIARWLKKEGDRIKVGEPLLEVDSEKAIVEVESFTEGMLKKILFPDGSTVMPQQVVGLIVSSDEEPIPVLQFTRKQSIYLESEKRGFATLAAICMAEENGIDLETISGSGSGGRIKVKDVRDAVDKKKALSLRLSKGTRGHDSLASPKARFFAKKFNVDLNGISGTGIDGMITVGDVQDVLDKNVSPTESDTNINIKPLSKMRRAIASKMQMSKKEVPHFYMMVDVNMSRVNTLREHNRETLKNEIIPTYTDIIVRACALTLKSMKELNVRFTKEGIEQRSSVDIGIAVAIQDGLLVPVVTKANDYNLLELSRKIKSLIERAHSGNLLIGNLGQKSMVVSNLGMYEIDAFFAIIDQPDSMILAVGRVTDRAVVVNGKIIVQPMCTLSLSVDHRVLDGVNGAMFLENVKEYLENPY